MSWYEEATTRAPTRVSQRGIDLVKRFEGYSRGAYPDPGTGAKPYTVGYGTTRIKGQPVRQGETVTEAQAEGYLADDLRSFEQEVLNEGLALNQNQFDAVVSLVYNIGGANFRSSTLLKKLKAGKFRQAAKEFPRWRRANGRILSGLARRRAAEKALFEEDVCLYYGPSLRGL